MNPWIIVGFLVALIAVGSGGYMKGQKDGKTASEAVWQAREAKINGETAAKIAANAKAVSAKEHAHATQLSAVDSDYQPHTHPNHFAASHDSRTAAKNIQSQGRRRVMRGLSASSFGSAGIWSRYVRPVVSFRPDTA